MYTIYNKGRKATKHTFESYEAARQWVRKQLRKQTSARVNGQPFDFDTGFSILGAGYSIKRV